MRRQQHTQPRNTAVRSIFILFLLILYMTIYGSTRAAPDACGGVTFVSNEAELNAAIADFNGQSSPCQFTIELAADIYLTTELPGINNENAEVYLLIEGAGFTVDSQRTYIRPFYIVAGSDVSLQNLTITGGRNGGIMNRGVLDLVGCTISGTGSLYSRGGGINNKGTMSVSDSSIIGNYATYDGGGIYNLGTAKIYNSKVSDNRTTGGHGGGIFNSGTVTIGKSILSGNSGGIAGGAVVNSGSAVVSNSVLSDNYSEVRGGGISNLQGGIVMVINSTVSDNTTLSYGAGISNRDRSTIIVSGSTLSGNSADYGGGIHNNQLGTLWVTNSTLSGNSADYGGSIWTHGHTEVINSTLSENSADLGGGILNFYGYLMLNNSIIANSTNGDCVSEGRTLSGTVIGKYNLIEDSSAACGLENGRDGNIIGHDPNLGLLQNNGGLTETYALLLSSPAIDRGLNRLSVDAAGAPLVADQRGPGFLRFVNTTVDMGAYEVQKGGIETGLAVVKRISVDQAVSGELHFYTIDVTNREAFIMENVTIVDDMTGSVNFVYSPDAECVQTISGFEDRAECDLGDLLPGETRTVRLFVKTKPVARDGHISDNETWAYSTTLDPQGRPYSGYDQVFMVYGNVHDLKIRKFGKPDDRVDEGQKLTYTIVVDNFGPGYAYNVKVRDLMASDGSYSFMAPDFCSPRNGETMGNTQINCDLGHILPGRQRLFTIEATAKEAQSLNNQVDVAADGKDLDNENNHAAVEHQIIDVADLKLALNVDRNQVMAGSDLLYTLDVRNERPGASRNVKVVGSLTEAAVLKSIESTKGNCLLSQLSCSMGTIKMGETATVTIKAAVKQSVGSGSTVNLETMVSADTYDADNSNDWATVTSSVMALRRLRLEMNSSADKAVIGQRFSLAVGVRNEGWGELENVMVNVKLSEMLEYVSDSVGCGPELKNCMLGDISAEGGKNLSILVQPVEGAAEGKTATSTAIVSNSTPSAEVDDANASVDVLIKKEQILFLPTVFLYSR